MDESPVEKIQRLKEEFRMANQALNFRALLAEKRDEMENTIEELKQKIEQDTFQLYRNKKLSREEIKHLTEKMQVDTQILARVKETKQELDAKLDEYELFSNEMTFTLKNELIRAILEQTPSQKRAYESLETAIHKNQTLHNTLVQIHNLMANIHEMLREVASERKSVKKMSILRYLFGKNPNVTIVNSLAQIERSSDELLQLQDFALQQVAEAEKSDTLLKRCFTQCLQLKNLCQGRWGWKKLDKEVIPFEELIGESTAKLEDTLSSQEYQIKELEKEMNDWIEKCGGF